MFTDRSQAPVGAGPSRQQRLGRALLKAWLLVALIYVAAAAAFSVAPIQSAIRGAPSEQVAPPGQLEARKGALRDPPPSQAVRIGKAVAIQAGITFAPPLLVLWFGWDVWFAVIGFLPGQARPPAQGPDAASDPTP